MDDRRLSPVAKVRLGAEILRDYFRARRLVRTTDLPTAVERLRAAPSTTGPLGVVSALRLANAVTRTLDIVPLDTRCLTRSLVLLSVLARRGTESRLVIGVKPGSEFGAHAWVELEGRPLLPPGADQFARLTEI